MNGSIERMDWTTRQKVEDRRISTSTWRGSRRSTYFHPLIGSEGCLGRYRFASTGGEDWRDKRRLLADRETPVKFRQSTRSSASYQSTSKSLEVSQLELELCRLESTSISTTIHSSSLPAPASEPLPRIELTSQGRGPSTTDDSSTLPSHQEESEGCESPLLILKINHIYQSQSFSDDTSITHSSIRVQGQC